MRKQKIEADKERENKISFLINLGFSKEDAIKNRLKVSSQNSYLHWMYKENMDKSSAIDKVSIIQKSKSPRCKEYWISRGYSELESTNNVSKYQDNVSLEFTISNGGSITDYKNKCNNRRINKNKYISIYGEEDGERRWRDKKEKSRITLKNMIRVHGEEDGERRWNSYIDKQRYSQSEDGLIKKHGFKKGLEIVNFRKTLNAIAIKKFIETGNNKLLCNNYSKSSQKLFWSIYEKISDVLKSKCYFQELNHEFTLIIEGKCYMYDFVISSINFCIEFNGDIWHANPNKYHSSDIIFEKKASDIWKNDKIKISSLKENRNIDTLIIWESDWIKNKIEVEDKILEKIIEKYDHINRESNRTSD